MGFKMVLLPPNTQADWPEKIRAVVPDCDHCWFGVILHDGRSL